MTRLSSFYGYLNKNNFYSKQELIDMYGEPSIINFENTLVLKDKDLFESYKNSDLITVKVNGIEEKVSKKLLKDIVLDVGMRHYVLDELDNKYGIAIRLCYIDESDHTEFIKISTSTLVSTLNQIKMELPREAKMFISFLNGYVNDSSFINKCGDAHTIIVDGSEVVIDVSYLHKIMVAENLKTFKSMIKNNPYGFSPEVISYALVDYVERNRILLKYVFAEETIKRYEDLKNYRIYDFESLVSLMNPHTYKNDGTDILDNVTIPEFIYDLIKYSNKTTYSNLEKSIVCYIELCNYLSINDIYTSNNDNNEKEFMFIMAKILRMLGIEFSLDQNLIINGVISDEALTFKSGEFILAIGSNNSTLSIKCLNKQDITKTKFNELIDKLFEEHQKSIDKNNEFNNAVLEYRSKYMNFKVSKKEKVKLLLRLIARKTLVGMDSIDYVSRMFKCVIGDEEGINITFVGHKDIGIVEPTPIIIISVDEDSDITYFEVNTKNKETIKKVSKNTLITSFDNGYYFFTNSDSHIEGLENKDEYFRSY